MVLDPADEIRWKRQPSGPPRPGRRRHAARGPSGRRCSPPTRRRRGSTRGPGWACAVFDHGPGGLRPYRDGQPRLDRRSQPAGSVGSGEAVAVGLGMGSDGSGLGWPPPPARPYASDQHDRSRRPQTGARGDDRRAAPGAGPVRRRLGRGRVECHDHPPTATPASRNERLDRSEPALHARSDQVVISLAHDHSSGCLRSPLRAREASVRTPEAERPRTSPMSSSLRSCW